MDVLFHWERVRSVWKLHPKATDDNKRGGVLDVIISAHSGWDEFVTIFPMVGPRTTNDLMDLTPTKNFWVGVKTGFGIKELRRGQDLDPLNHGRLDGKTDRY